MKAIEEIPDEEFTRAMPKSFPMTNQRIQYLLDEIIFSINEQYPISNDQGVKLNTFIRKIKDIFVSLCQENGSMRKDITNLQVRTENLLSCTESLQKEQTETKKLRTVGEILTPVVKEIRISMVQGEIPDAYYCPDRRISYTSYQILRNLTRTS